MSEVGEWELSLSFCWALHSKPSEVNNKGKLQLLIILEV